MSPEQAEGKKVDSRSDVFSFGSVLYEMLDGPEGLQRESRIATLASILNEEPKPAVAVQRNAPAGGRARPVPLPPKRPAAALADDVRPQGRPAGPQGGFGIRQASPDREESRPAPEVPARLDRHAVRPHRRVGRYLDDPRETGRAGRVRDHPADLRLGLHLDSGRFPGREDVRLFFRPERGRASRYLGPTARGRPSVALDDSSLGRYGAQFFPRRRQDRFSLGAGGRRDLRGRHPGRGGTPDRGSGLPSRLLAGRRLDLLHGRARVPGRAAHQDAVDPGPRRDANGFSAGVLHHGRGDRLVAGLVAGWKAS